MTEYINTRSKTDVVSSAGMVSQGMSPSDRLITREDQTSSQVRGVSIRGVGSDIDIRETSKIMGSAVRDDSDEEGLSSDSNSIDDDVLRSVDAFSDSEGDQNYGDTFRLDIDAHNQ